MSKYIVDCRTEALTKLVAKAIKNAIEPVKMPHSAIIKVDACYEHVNDPQGFSDLCAKVVVEVELH